MQSKHLILLAFSTFWAACAAPEKQAVKEVTEGSPAEVAPSMSLAVCACYQDLAESVRISQSPAFVERKMTERNSFMQRIDTLSNQASICFAGVKERYKIAQKKKAWTKEIKDEFEEKLSNELKNSCTNVGKLLAGEKFY